VLRSLEQVRDEHAAIETNKALLLRSLERRWDVEDISRIDWREIQIDKTADGFDMTADYEAEEPFVGNVYLLVKFNRTVSVPQ
jgi:hypothetical protein